MVDPIMALHLLGIVHIGTEQIRNDLCRAGTDTHDIRVAINALEQHLLDLLIGFGHLGRESRDDAAGAADIGNAVRLDLGERLL